MITISRVEKLAFNQEDPQLIELRGLSTDTKPSEIDGIKVGNGSTFIEIDTGKIFFYDQENELWKEI